MPEATRAVFLSYAREDADAARRIGDALRSQGVEVWFDQSELRGGDAWDAKIRKQIKECALFLPIISNLTQERGEGYFRLEWKLAVERTHLMAEGRIFLAPVVIDDTPEGGALVPAEFMKVQWTRLPGALPTPQFVEHVKHLLELPAKTVSAPKPVATGASATAALRKSGIPGWTWGALTALVIGVVVVLTVGRKSEPPAPVAAPPPVQPVAPAVSDKSIAVLPFENMSEDKDNNAFFADGIHEDLLTNLALVPELKVISRTSVMQYRGTTKTTRQIGTELGVAYVLEGSVRRAGNKVRVTGQLINARTDEHVWAKSYDRDLTDIFAIQAALSQEIAGALSAAISPQTQKFITRRPTENPAAYDLYLKGRDSRNRSPTSSEAALREQEAEFKGAVQLDPNFAAAWGQLAVVHALYVFWGIDGSSAQLAAADAAIAQAVRLEPDSPAVIDALGTYAYYAYRDYARATAEFEKLARLQPNNAAVYLALGLIQRRQARWSEALGNFRRALDLDPASIKNARTVAEVAFMCRRWAEARAAHQRLLALLPDQLREQLDFADFEFAATGSWVAVDELLARLTPAQRDSPVGVFYRKNWAMYRGDYAEFRRLDQLQPSLDSELPAVYSEIYAGGVYFAAGDMAAVRARLAAPLVEWRARVEREPTNAWAWGVVGQFEALLGHPAEAIRLTRKAMELVPESRDAVDGPWWRLYLAMAYAVNGDKDRAMDELNLLLRVPQVYSAVQIRALPAFAKLRGDPRFEALLNDPKNNEPLF